MTSFFWSTLLLVATGATARKEFIYDVILLEYLATGCYSRKEFIYDVILLEYLATGCYRCYSRKEFIYDVILLEYLATGCYRCYSSQGVYLWRHSFGIPCYWLLQVLQLARSLAMTSFFWNTLLLVATACKDFSYDVILLEYRATGCYRCYSSQRVYLWRQFFRVLCCWLLQVLRVRQVATSLAVIRLQLARSISMTSFFWNTLLLAATGATARKEFSYDVILLEYLATGCYRCYSLQRF